MRSIIGRTVANAVLPFILLFGLYVSFHGHLSPGGGFAGGTIIGAGMLLVLLLDLPIRGKAHLSRALTLFDSGGVLVYALIGLFGVLAGTGFMSNLSAGFPRGVVGRVLSAGFMVPLGLAICLKVGSTITALFLSLGDEGGIANDQHD